MNILIGSRALAHWNPQFKLKDNADWDIISSRPIDGAEWHDRSFLNNSHFDEYAENSDIFDFNGHLVHIMNPTGLSIIKRSHLWRNLGFQKHITHYHKFMVTRKCYDLHNERLLQERIKLTKAAFPQGNPSLMQSRDAFFDDAVTKKYDHDYLHTLLAYYDAPLYTRLLKTDDLVWCEQDAWHRLSHDDKVKCVAEESYVIAIERFMVPHDWKFPIKLAYLKSVDKVCTTLCSGWFRDFAIDNYPSIVNMFEASKFNLTQSILKGTTS